MFHALIEVGLAPATMNRFRFNKINVLIIMALAMAPLHLVFAADALSFGHPAACHTEHHGHAGDHDLERMQMMVDCEHSTGMQHDSGSSCQADAQSGAVAFATDQVVVIPIPATSFIYHSAMAGVFVSLLAKPPRLTL